MPFWSSPATPQLSPSALSLCASLVFLCPSVSIAQTPECVTFPSRKICPERDLCDTAHSVSDPADPRGVTAVCPRAYFCLHYLKYLLYERSLLSNTYTCQTYGKQASVCCRTPWNLCSSRVRFGNSGPQCHILGNAGILVETWEHAPFSPSLHEQSGLCLSLPSCHQREALEETPQTFQAGTAGWPCCCL